jgi:hypothetical protein
MIGVIFNFTQTLLFIFLFIIMIPDFFFKIPSNGTRIIVSLVHGLIYAGAFVILDIIFNSKRIYLCAKSMGSASV